MSSAVMHPDDGIYAPDEVLVPESSVHRRLSMLIHVAVADLVGDANLVRGNLNWYPPDRGNAIAPDVMVFGRVAMAADATSYQQGPDDPTPVAVVEVPSHSDDVMSFMTKQTRLHRLGTAVYIVMPGDTPTVTRHGRDDDEPRRWLGLPCPELGGLVFKVDGDQLSVWMPDGITAGSAEELLAQRTARADEAGQHAREADERAREADERAARLAAQLRSAGIEPEV